MDRVEVGIPLTPPRSLVRGILVNGQGRRFMNEDTYSGRLGQEFLLRQDGQVYFVHDDETFTVNVVGYKPSGSRASAAELEEEIGLPVRLPHRHARPLQPRRRRGRRHRAPQGRRVARGRSNRPTAWSTCASRRAIYAPFTLGGLATNVDSEVLDGSGVAIPGLFAAGRTTAGIAAGGYVSGISLGDGTFFGRRAGVGAARTSS